MYVCICKAVDEVELTAALKDASDLTTGAVSLEDVQKQCGAGTDCGSCRFKIERHLRQHNARCEATNSMSAPLKKAN